MLVSFFLAVVAINGSLVHVVPMLTDRGMPLPDAVAIISSSGIALIVGRLLAGWIIDRIFAPYVAVFFLVCPLAGLLVLALQPAAVSPLVGVLLLGLGIGGETDLLSYMVSRYFGLASSEQSTDGFSPRRWPARSRIFDHGWAFQLTHSYSATLVPTVSVGSRNRVYPGSWALTAIPPSNRHDMPTELALRAKDL